MKKLLILIVMIIFISPVFAGTAGNDTLTAPLQKQSVFLPMIGNPGVNVVPVKNLTVNKDSYLSPNNKRITSSEEAALKDYENYFVHYTKTHWKPPQPKKPYEVILLVDINKDGTLKNILLKQSSDDTETDNYTVNLVKSLAPYKPLPAVSELKSVTIELHFQLCLVNKDLSPNNKRITSSEEAALKDYENYFTHYTKTRWKPPQPKKSYDLILFIKLNTDGSINSVSIAQSSGDAETDNYTVNLVKSLAPYEPLPVVSELKSVDILIHFNANIFVSPNLLNDTKASITRKSPSNVLLKNLETSEQKNILKKYLKNAKEKVSNPEIFMQSSQIYRTSTVKIRFDINKNGFVSSAEITDSSGNVDFGKALLNHIWKTRFDRIPSELNLNSLPVEMEFTLNRF